MKPPSMPHRPLNCSMFFPMKSCQRGMSSTGWGTLQILSSCCVNHFLISFEELPSPQFLMMKLPQLINVATHFETSSHGRQFPMFGVKESKISSQCFVSPNTWINIPNKEALFLFCVFTVLVVQNTGLEFSIL